MFLRDPARAVFVLVFIVGMMVAAFWIVRPFLPSAVWAATIAIATWPLMRRVQGWLWARRGFAVAIMSVLLLLCLIVPLVLALTTIAAHVDDVAGWLQSVVTSSLPQPPEWLARLPFVGAPVAARWAEIAAASPDEIAARVQPHMLVAAAWVAGTIGGIGLLLGQFLLVVVFTAIFYASGERMAAGTLRFAHRLAGARGEHSARLAAGAIRGVAMGIVVTAVVQTILAAIGLFAAGIPFAPVLTAIVFVLCIAQIGPLLVLLLAVVWMYWTGAGAWATGLLLAWSVLVAALDNVLRPVLIRRGADLPLLLVFVGVVGGLFAFGIIGLFIGPVVLAVGYSLLADWTNTAPPAAAFDDPASRAIDRDFAPVS
jgi:predicted PurR-regulated permease PerM